MSTETYSNDNDNKKTNTRPNRGYEGDKDKKLFMRKKTCWFTAQNIEPNWKDPETYLWLINEFGKISPARVTGVSTKYQKMATKAIKRARNVGLISHLHRSVTH
jgi:small subunit ribosomal protein S6